MTDKINTLITTFQSTSKEKIDYDDSNSNNKDQDEEKKNTLNENNVNDDHVKYESKKTDTLDRKFIFNYVSLINYVHLFLFLIKWFKK